MAATRYVEDLSGDARDFNKAKWIRQNRKYPADPPAELLAYKDTLYEIPRQYQLLLIPNLTLNIIQFTELKLPETTSTLIEYAAKNSFSEQEATEDTSCLANRNLPSRTFVNNAKLAFGQAMLDGARSIDDPYYKGGLLPLWTVQYWNTMHNILDDQKTWQKALQWLKQHDEDNSARRRIFNECWTLLSFLQWNTSICLPGGAGPVTDLAQLLGDKLVSGNIIDMMMEHLAERIKADEDASRTYHVATLSFQDHLNKEWNTRKSGKYVPKFLRQIVTEMKKTPKILLLPIHMNSIKHYVGFAIDFKDQLLYHGKQDSVARFQIETQRSPTLQATL